MTRITELKPAIAPSLTIAGQPFHAHRVDRDRDRIGHVELLVIDDPGQNDRPQAIEDRADDQRTDDSDRHVALRVFGLLSGRRDRVEPDVGEEDEASPPENAAPAVFDTIPRYPE